MKTNLINKMKEFFESISSKLIGVYILWITIHFILLVVDRKYEYANNYFIPFSKQDENFTSYYDLSEFTVYTLVPIFLYLSYYFIHKKDSINKNMPTQEEKSDNLIETDDNDDLIDLFSEDNDEMEEFCDRCNQPVSSNQITCSNCGKRLKIHCYECSELCSLDAEKCSSCGTKLFLDGYIILNSKNEFILNEAELFDYVELACEECGGKRERWWNYCIVCGNMFEFEDDDEINGDENDELPF